MGNHDSKLIQSACENFPQIDVPVEHFYSDGVYCRMMIMEPNTYLVGKTHKHNHIAVLLEGTVQVVSKYGTALFDAPYIANINIGDKRAFNSITKVKWMTIHVTNETDLEKLELELVEA